MIIYNIEILKFIFLIIILIISVFTDIRKRKIYNYITLPGILMGIIFNGINYKAEGMINSLEGIAVAFAIFILPYILGIIGGGDLKLVMTVGAFSDSSFAFSSSIAAIIFGGFISLTILLKNKNIKFHNFFEKFKILIYQKKVIDADDKKNYFPYSIAILCGVITALLMKIFLGVSS